MIKPTDIGGDEDLARRVILHARTIAPCIDTLEDVADDDAPKPKSDAIAILKAAAAVGAARGSHLVKSQRLNAAAVEYSDVSSWFSAEDRAALRHLCGASSAGHPIGDFPAPARAISRIWPEE